MIEIQLYKVTITAFVVADDEDSAMFEAHHADPMACDVVVTQPERVPSEWAGAYPFGDSDGMTCLEWLEKERRVD